MNGRKPTPCTTPRRARRTRTGSGIADDFFMTVVAGKHCRRCSFRPFPGSNFPFFGQVQLKIVNGPDWFDFRARAVHVGIAKMHEVSIMAEALRMAVDAAKSAGANRVLKLRLRVGSFSGVVPEAMRFAFDVVCRDTMAEGADLEIDVVPAACWCGTCRMEFECADYYNECPRCHNVCGELLRGRELEIVDVELN